MSDIPQPELLGETPQARKVTDAPKEGPTPETSYDLLWYLGDKGEDGLDVEIHPDLKYNGDDEWNDEDEWQWFVNMHGMRWNGEEHIEELGDMVSRSFKDFDKAVEYAQTKAEDICKNNTTLDLKYLTES